MSEEFRWGIIGTGGIAKEFARDLSYFNDHIIAAVGSRELSSAQAFAAEFPGCSSYASYAELVADPMIDAVYVATPHNFHAAHTILALSAGKPVLCEKPFAINAVEARAMVEASIENHVALMEAMWTRFLPHIVQVRSIIASGILGEILSVHADHGQRLSDFANPRHWEPELGGGALLDLGIYPVSFSHLILGAPQSITASAAFTDKGVDAQTSAIFTYANGAHAVLNTTLLSQTPNRAVVAGTNGWLEIDRTFYSPTDMRVVTHDGDVTEYPNTYKGHGLREEAAEFARIVRAGELESPLLTNAQTIAVMESMDEIRRQIGLTYSGDK